MVAFDHAAHDDLPALVIAVDEHGGILDYNRAVAELVGRSAAEALGEPLWSLSPAPDAAARVKSALSQIGSAGEGNPTPLELSLEPTPGRRLTIAFAASREPSDRPGPRHILLIGVDVTDAIAEREQETRGLGLLIDEAPDAIFITSPEGYFVDVNTTACKLLGYTREEMLHKRPRDIIAGDQTSRVPEARRRFLEEGVSVERWRLRRKDGSQLDVEIAARRLSDGRWAGFIRDLSDSARLEASLRAANATLNRAQEVAKLGSWRFTLANKQVVWSEETYRIFGLPRDTPMTYERFLTRVHPDDRAMVDESWQAALAGKPYEIEHRIVVGGQIKWVRETADFELEREGQAAVAVGVVQDITAQRLATEEQRLWQERLDAIISIAADAVISVDDEQHIVIFNQGAETIFGWSREEILGKSLDLLIPARFRAAHREHVRRFADEPRRSRSMGERGIAIWGLRKNGEEFPAEAAISKVDVADSRLFTVSLRDISDRRAAEEALRVGEERLRVSLKASPVAVWNQDRELRYTWIHNPAPPFRSSEMLGKTDFDLMPQEEASALAALKRGVLDTGVGARRVVGVTPAGATLFYDLVVEPLRDATGQVAGITCAAWDVTEARRAEEEQRLLARVGEMLMAASPDYDAMLTQLAHLAVEGLASFIVVDVIELGEMRRIKVDCSSADRRALADELERFPMVRERPTLVSKSIHERRPLLMSEVDPRFVESLAQSPEHLRLLRSLNIRSLLTAPLLARGRLLGAFTLISSSDTRRYQERDLRFAEQVARVAAFAVDNAQLYLQLQRAIAARDEVLGIVAHDLRNPLTSIVMQTQQLIRRDGELAPKERAGLDAIQRAARRMTRLIGDMLDVARLEAGSIGMRRAPLDPRDLLEEVHGTHKDPAAETGIALRLDLASYLPAVFGDRDRLTQVLDNLISNALKFTPPGGTVVLGAHPEGRGIHFWVMDDGKGISPEHIPHLFDRFWQAAPADLRGAGLGLSIVKGIVEAHGGRVWIESELGRGTTVHFTAPLAAPKHEEPPRPGASP